MVGNECSIHFSDFELEGVLNEASSDQIVVLPFEALEFALFFIDRVLHVLLISFYIVSDRGTGPGFYFEHEWFTVFIYVTAIYLRSKE